MDIFWIFLVNFHLGVSVDFFVELVWVLLVGYGMDSMILSGMVCGTVRFGIVCGVARYVIWYVGGMV